MRKHKTNKESGITLIALVVTIIVLLLLAGITIQTISGNNGILEHTINAKDVTEQTQETENIQSAYLNATSKDKYDVTIKTLNKELQNNSINGTATKAGESIKVSLENGNTYLIDQDGKLSEYKKSEISPVYVVIYSDGEMVFNSTREKDNTRTILYDGTNNDIGNTEFTKSADRPWHDYRSNVTSVTFKNSVVPKITACWFTSFSNLSSINGIKLLDTSNVTSMYGMFAGCSSLSSLDLSSFDTSNVNNIKQMFQQCGNLKSLNISNFETKNVTTMRSMFAGCLSLESLDLSSFNTSNVIDMYGMFAGNQTVTMNLKTIKGLEGFDTQKVENMGSMFQACRYLEELDLMSFNTENVTSMFVMFNSCDSLKKIYVSDSFVTTSVTDSRGMFQYCNSLVGNNGTKFISSTNDASMDATMAKIDTAVYDSEYNLISGTPGYFSTK